jgi:hypothetical protein
LLAEAAREPSQGQCACKEFYCCFHSICGLSPLIGAEGR